MPEYNQPKRRGNYKEIPLPDEQPKPVAKKKLVKKKKIRQAKKDVKKTSALPERGIAPHEGVPTREHVYQPKKRTTSDDLGNPVPMSAQKTTGRIPEQPVFPLASTSNPVEERRRAVENKSTAKRRKRKRSYTLYYAAIAIVAIILLSVLSVTVLFNANSITVAGDSIYSEQQILDAGNVKKGDNLIRMNTGSIEKRILENLVCLDGVKVEKSFPDGLTITVEGASEYANISDGTNYYVISAKNRVLKISDKAEKCIIVYGFEPVAAAVGEHLLSSDENKTNLVAEIVTAISETGFSGVTSVDITDRLDIRMDYGGRIKLKLGSKSDISEKLSIAKTLIEEHIPDNQSAELDVSNTQKVTQHTLSEQTTAPVTTVPDDTSDSDTQGTEQSATPEATNAPSTTAVPEDTTAPVTSAPDDSQTNTGITTAGDYVTTPAE